MKVVLFGNGPFAGMAWYWLSHDSPLTVAGFTVDEAYVRGHSHHELPVVRFDSYRSKTSGRAVDTVTAPIWFRSRPCPTSAVTVRVACFKR